MIHNLCGKNASGWVSRWRLDPVIPVEGGHAVYEEYVERASGFEPKRTTLGIYGQMGSALRIFSQKLAPQPMLWEPSGKPVTDMGSHLRLPRADRVGLNSAIYEMVERAWPADTRPELALCKEVGEVRVAFGIPSRHCNCE